MVNHIQATVLVVVAGDPRIYRLLSSLIHQTAPRSSYEVIVVEKGSSLFQDVGKMENLAIRYMHLAEANSAKARNLGLRAARGQYLLMTDADVVVRSDWVERMIGYLEADRYAAVGGRIRKFEPRTWTQRYAITIVNGQSELNYLPVLNLPYVVGANSGFVTTLVRDVGGFDDRFLSGSDVDICYRLGLAGKRIGLAPDAVVFHEDRPNVRAHFRRFKLYAIYQVLLFATYRKVSKKRFVINTYPLRRTAQALANVPCALVRLMRGDIGPWSRGLLQLTEAAGIWCGDIQGSIRYRQF